MKDLPVFDRYYEENFDDVKAVCGYQPAAAEIIAELKKAGIRVVLATNPIFPSIATRKRIGWAGLEPEMFEIVTTYENSKYCKPNLCYYQALLQQLDVAPEECLMVGNDVGDDMVVQALGMKTYLLTDCLINKTEHDISDYDHGSFSELRQLIHRLCQGS